MKGFLRAVQNLTIIYIKELEFSEETFGRATMYFPLVGLVIGVILTAVYAFTSRYFPNTIVAAILLVLEIFLTGAMHLDGMADTMDGLMSGRPRERKLEIMKDSRVGAHGVVSLFSIFILKFALFRSLTEISDISWLLLTPVISRWCMVYAIRFFPYARPEGMGKAYHDYTTNTEFAWATAFTFVLSIFSLNPLILIVLLVSITATHLMAGKMTASLGGLTGDTYGAINEIIEVLLLLLFYLILRY